MHLSTEKLLHFTKVKANRIAKDTMAGPGKFGVFIFFCILIVGIHDGLTYFGKSKTINKNPCMNFNSNNMENTRKIKEIFPQTHEAKNEENKTKKMLYMNVIKRNQSAKENEENLISYHYNWEEVEKTTENTNNDEGYEKYY